MICLNNTTSTLEVVLAGAVATTQPDVVASYDVHAVDSYSSVKKAFQTNNTTAVTVIPSPGASIQFSCHYLSVYNADTASVTVTVRYKDTAAAPTTYILRKVTLLTLEHLVYTHGGGWKCIDANGNEK